MSSPALFSVHPPMEKPDDYPLPDNGPYYIYTRNGWLVHRRFHWGRGLFRTKEPPSIAQPTPFLWSDVGIPIERIGQAWSFFRSIWETRHSEAMLDLIFDPDEARRAKRTAKQGFDDLGYRWMVWPQQASSGGVECKRDTTKIRGQRVGTIHSHCDFGAYHSGTDEHDAKEDDGLHITLGHVNTNKPSIAIMMSVSGDKWHYKPEELWEDPTLFLVPHPEWWNGYVKERSAPAKYAPAQTTVIRGHNSHKPRPQPAAVSSIVIPGTSTAQRKNNKPPFYTVEEIYEDDKAMTADEVMELLAAQDLLDEITRLSDKFGLDFDYEWNRQIGWEARPEDEPSSTSMIVFDNEDEHWRAVMRRMAEEEA